MNEILNVVLVVTFGFSPGSANDTSMDVQRFPQPTMEKCLIQEKRVNEFRDGRFEYHAICIEML